MRTRLARRVCCSWLLVLFTCGTGYAQYTGNIQGIVQDPSGGAVANATLEAVNLARAD